MSRIKIILPVLLAFVLNAKAQNTTYTVNDSTVNKDSTKGINFLLVPFNPAMYFSDADKDIAEFSNIEPHKVKDKFNGSLEASVADKMLPYYNVKQLSKQNDAGNDMDIIFGSLSYSPENIAKPNDNGEKKAKLAFRKKDEQNDKAEKSSETEAYMNISFADNRLLEYLCDKYSVQYVVFFNQFEVKTDYKNCIDLQLRQYYREIKVHYSTFSKSGKKISGGVVTLPYHSNENRIEQIVKENFGTVSAEILERIYHKR